MKQTIKRFLGIAAASALIIGATTGAFAGGGFGPGWGGHHGMMGGPAGRHGPLGGSGWMTSGDPVADADQRLTELETTLGITPEQQDVWNAYADAVLGKAGVMAAHHQAMSEAGTVAAEQRIGFHQQGFEQMQQLNAAARDLYATLTPEQRTKSGGLIGPPCRAW